MKSQSCCVLTTSRGSHLSQSQRDSGSQDKSYESQSSTWKGLQGILCYSFNRHLQQIPMATSRVFVPLGMSYLCNLKFKYSNIQLQPTGIPPLLHLPVSAIPTPPSLFLPLFFQPVSLSDLTIPQLRAHAPLNFIPQSSLRHTQIGALSPSTEAPADWTRDKLAVSGFSIAPPPTKYSCEEGVQSAPFPIHLNFHHLLKYPDPPSSPLSADDLTSSFTVKQRPPQNRPQHFQALFPTPPKASVFLAILPTGPPQQRRPPFGLGLTSPRGPWPPFCLPLGPSLSIFTLSVPKLRPLTA